MRIVLAIALLAALAACDGPPALPQANGPMMTWNTSMWGVAAPPPSPQALPPGTPLASAADLPKTKGAN